MSTKSTMHRYSEPGPDGEMSFHLYTDVLTGDSEYGPIYLNLVGVKFEACNSPNSITVTIPIAWAKMLGLMGHNAAVEPPA